MAYGLRSLTVEDEDVLWEMLMYAAHETSVASVRQQPYLARYAIEWGREGDLGYLAQIGERPVGAVWLRLWQGEDKGFGYLEDTIPELAMAVHPEHRGQGIGTALLNHLLAFAQTRYSAISLSVRSGNPVIHLYERVGFVKVEGSESVNRVGSISFCMVCRWSLTRLRRSPAVEIRETL
jgi:ribosomal protein S18 acetylase RimI-like enzyme